ncbi:MAG: helix-turn-helix domain-containing protein [Thermoproteota archaeon]|nr:helix-turn-helix domain-containing protein [Thermoproteota archaeon]
MYKENIMDKEDSIEFCTIKDAAKRSGLALKTWYQGAAGTHTVPRIRFGRSVRLLRSDVDNFIKERVTKAKQNASQQMG